VIKLAKS